MKTNIVPAVAAVAALLTSGVRADEFPISKAKSLCASESVGPRTVYGETKAEASARKIAFDWSCMVMVEGKPREAFEKYVSKDFCDHSHIINHGLKECGNYDEALAGFMAMGGGGPGGRQRADVPIVATVNGEMVTQFGEGVDIFRVHDGKITDHWDASPARDRTLKAHSQAFSDALQKQIDTGVPLTLPLKIDMPTPATPPGAH